MNKNTINIKTLNTIYDIFETKKTKIKKTKSILIKIYNSIFFFNCKF